MYVPASFAVTDIAQIAAFVTAAQSASLVTFDGIRPVATLMPVIWDRPPGGAAGHGRLLGHLARANPQWQTAQPGAQALAIVRGPQAYISPSWYPSTAEHGRNVPTWNYQEVHLAGTVTFREDADWLADMVTRLTERHEEGRPAPWRVQDAPAKFVAGQLRAIVGVELAVTSVEAKDKLGQNRLQPDQQAAAGALRGEPGAGAARIAELMAAQAAARAGQPRASGG